GDARLDIAHRAERTAHVARVDRAGEAVARAVQYLHRLLEALNFDDREHGTENLFLRDAHRRRDAVENRRPVEPAVDPLLSFVDRAAGQKPRAFVLADLHVAVRLFARGFVDERPHLGALVQAVADDDLLGARDEGVGYALLDLAVHDQAARRGAALAGRAKGAPQRSFDGQVQIGVFEDDLGVFSAHLERDALEIFPARCRDLASDFRGAGEGDQLNLRMIHERGAGDLTGAVDEVGDAGRNDRL